MTDAVVVLCTVGDQQDALRLGSAVVEERLAACVNILPAVQSIYRWQGEVERATEILLLMKTTQQGFAALRDRLEELHPYETPEIIALPIVDGLGNYLGWMREQVK